jgi:hypothetical protein
MPIQGQNMKQTWPKYTFPWHTILKTTSTENKERILKAVREKNQNIKVNPSK